VGSWVTGNDHDPFKIVDPFQLNNQSIKHLFVITHAP